VAGWLGGLVGGAVGKQRAIAQSYGGR